MTDALAIDGGTPVRSTLLPYGRQSIEEGDTNAVSKALLSDFLTTGPQVSAFEKEFAAYTGAAEAVAVSSGTTALHCSMYALGIGPGDEVIVPAMTFIATANAVRMQGGTPIIADTDPDSLLIDVADVEKKITTKTKAVIAVDYAGQPCDYDELRALCDSKNLALVDDACHSLGAQYKGRSVGTLADLNIFSFHPVKAITTGEGGMITTDNKDFADAMRKFRNHGISKTAEQRQQQDTWLFEIEDLGYNYRLTDFQCALGRWQLGKLPDMLGRRQKIAQRYDEAFAALPITPVAKKDDRTHGYHLYMIMIDTDALTADRKQVFEALRAEGIGVNVHYIPVHMHKCYASDGDAKCPVVESAYERLITLPLFADMSEGDTQDVITAVEKVCAHYAK
jgi:perosamine synthetase